MDNTSYIALSRQMVLQRQMDLVANNIANAATSGFKGQKMVFEEVLEDAGARKPVSFVQDVGVMRDLSPGALTTTDNPFDLAVGGDGWFTVGTQDGPRYTRNGNFMLSAEGRIVTNEGLPLLDEGGAPLTLPAGDRRIAVARDGTVSTPAGVVGRIAPVAFADGQQMKPIGSSLYETDEPPLPAEGASIVQGAVEGSNVQPVLEMTRMMETVRAFQNTQRLLETHHDLVRRAVEQNLSNQA
ncbi:MAG: flagellar basal-body rod protein FlgF [Geminicoccaceae bacterium]|nr:flagellar basal-body rod protein FlgF [Geminicoccaceae bacterium]